VPISWEHDRAHWPHAGYSRFVDVGDVHWHLQDLGDGPVVLLVHGTGASTHSWAGVMPLLAGRFRVVAVDLPGHAFSLVRVSRASSLTGMAAALGSLLTAEDVRPDIVVGHSAGAAVLARACLDGILRPRQLVSVNGALLPLRGLAGQLFAPAARFLARVPVVPQLFARRAVDRRLVLRLLADTGSRVPAASVDCYQRLMCTPTHVAAALQMMANWDLDPLSRALAGLDCPLQLVACGNDRTVPPSDAEQLARRLPQGHLVRVPGLGHLGHEEDPQRFADLLTTLAGSA
jgi:magnesium chelatase accessory protein